MGQSNMAGSGVGYDKDYDGPNNDRIQQWARNNTIITASERLQHNDFSTADKTKVGPGLAFGRTYIETLPENRNVLLVPTARGGTKLVNGDWAVGGELFEDAVERMTAALASNGATGNCVAAVLWHQGETDFDTHEEYQEAWTDMIDTLRTSIQAAAEAPVILGEFTTEWIEESQKLRQPILDVIRAIPLDVSFTAVAPSEGLETNPNNIIHFDAPSQRRYGQRYFDTLSEAISNV